MSPACSACQMDLNIFADCLLMCEFQENAR